MATAKADTDGTMYIHTHADLLCFLIVSNALIVTIAEPTPDSSPDFSPARLSRRDDSDHITSHYESSIPSPD
jgi:hypothetical protein